MPPEIRRHSSSNLQLLHTVKGVDGLAFQMPAGAEHRGREAVAVHAVGEELGLQGNGVAVAEDLAAVAFPGGQEAVRTAAFSPDRT